MEFYENTNQTLRKKDRREPNQDLDKLISRINLNEDSRFDNVEHRTQKEEKIKNRFTDKKNRATCEQVLDPRTRIILLKLINQSVLDEINGCISTGKEANVYHAMNGLNKHVALKIFKTSILKFKDRKKYVEDEFRFRSGYTKNNPRKMVRQWAEKEFRNLKRIEKAGIKAPRPLFIKQHVIGISFIGCLKEGIPAPRLKEYKTKNMEVLYIQTIEIMCVLYKECKLVHGDLSEYNLLIQENNVYLIDVSQSVENDHPLAMEFLKRDCLNILKFFKEKVEKTLSINKLFSFILQIDSFENIKTDLENLHKEEQEIEKDELLLNSFVPKTLHEIDEKHILKKEEQRFLQKEKKQEKQIVKEEKKVIEAHDHEEKPLGKKERKKKVKEENKIRRIQKKKEKETKKKKKTKRK